MFKNKLIKKLYKEIEELKEKNKSLYDDRYELQTKLIEQREMYEKKNRKKILKDYDIAVLVKNNITYLIEKGQEEKMISSFTLRQNAGNAPVIEIEKVLYGRLYR